MGCDVAGVCGGCPWILRDPAEQRDAKRAHLRALAPKLKLGPLPMLACDGRRDRVDLSFRAEGGILGLGKIDDRDALVDVGPCPALSPALRAHVAEVQADPPPVPTASLRFRVAPDSSRGLWIDTANVLIKELMDEGAWLRRRLSRGAVELGQRRKDLVDSDRLRLQDPVLRPWFSTPGSEGDLPLYTVVGGFTQPSLAANRALVGAVMALVAQTGASRWLEIGAGCGNFTLPLAQSGARVLASETDPLGRAGLEHGARALGLEVELIPRDLARPGAAWPEVDALLLDPPRSGLPRLHEVLAEQARMPEHIVYVSCAAESFVRDLDALIHLGYRLESLSGVDQFPDTPHCEWVGWLRR